MGAFSSLFNNAGSAIGGGLKSAASAMGEGTGALAGFLGENVGGLAKQGGGFLQDIGSEFKKGMIRSGMTEEELAKMNEWKDKMGELQKSLDNQEAQRASELKDAQFGSYTPPPIQQILPTQAPIESVRGSDAYKKKPKKGSYTSKYR